MQIMTTVVFVAFAAFLGGRSTDVYTGNSFGSWFENENWMSGAVPDASTTVSTNKQINVAEGEALAADVMMQPGGGLILSNSGSLKAQNLTAVTIASHVQLLDPTALLDLDAFNNTQNYNLNLTWLGGTIRIGKGGMFYGDQILLGSGENSELILHDGATVTIDAFLWIDPLGSVRGEGTLQSIVVNWGLIEVGDPVGILNVEGELGIHKKLAIDLGGSNPGVDQDLINVNGPVFLGQLSTLKVNFMDGFQPVAGDSFTILTASTISGQFGNLEFPSLSGNLTFSVHYEPNAVRLDVLVSADLDGDGQVGGADLGLLLANWGGSGPGDFNADNIVDGADLGYLLAQWSE